MKYVLPFFLLFVLISPDCAASVADDDGESSEAAIFQPGPCLEMLAKKFQEPHRRCSLLLSSLSFKEIAQADRSEYGGEKNGMRWGWKLSPGHKIPTWHAVACRDVEVVQRLKYALSFYHFRSFYQAFDQLEKDSDMQKLWYMLFDD